MYGVLSCSWYLSINFFSELKVYLFPDFTSMGEILCLLVTLPLVIKKSISMRIFLSFLDAFE